MLVTITGEPIPGPDGRLPRMDEVQRRVMGPIVPVSPAVSPVSAISSPAVQPKTAVRTWVFLLVACLFAMIALTVGMSY